MEIVLNGEPTKLPKEQTILDLLQHLQVDPSRVAVEINRKLIRKTEWNNFQVSAGDEVEIVHFVGGGSF